MHNLIERLEVALIGSRPTQCIELSPADMATWRPLGLGTRYRGIPVRPRDDDTSVTLFYADVGPWKAWPVATPLAIFTP